MIHVTWRFKHREIPIEVTVDASNLEAIDFSVVSFLIEKSKDTVDELISKGEIEKSRH